MAHQALYMILKQLSANFPVPILCVQHISEGFLQGLVDWLAVECSLRVKDCPTGRISQTRYRLLRPRTTTPATRRSRAINHQAPLPFLGIVPPSQRYFDPLPPVTTERRWAFC